MIYIWTGKEGDDSPGQRVGQLDTTGMTKAERKAAIHAAVVSHAGDGIYVYAHDADTGKCAGSRGVVPASFTPAKLRRELVGGFRVVASQVTAELPRDAWVNITEMQVRASADGSIVDVRFRYRESGGG